MLTLDVKTSITEEENEALKSDWMGLCDRLKIPEDDAEGMFDQLYYEYSDWDRHYHNLSHLQGLLRIMTAPSPASEPCDVESTIPEQEICET